jgi:hypothetical protein
VPAPEIVTVAGLVASAGTVQGPLTTAIDTGSPEVAVAVTPNDPALNGTMLERKPKLTVWLALLIVKVRTTSGAGL